MRILIPDSYIITASSGLDKSGPALLDAISNDQTYKSASVLGSGSVSVNSQRTMAAFFGGGVVPAGIVPPARQGKFAAWFGETNTASWTGTGELIHLASGTAYDFPALPASEFTPRQYDTTFTNNISGMGEFLGRSVVRRGLTVSLAPMSFSCDASRFSDVDKVVQAMRTGCVYVLADTPAGQEVYYGWTEQEPEVKYTGDVSQASISFSLRCPL